MTYFYGNGILLSALRPPQDPYLLKLSCLPKLDPSGTTMKSKKEYISLMFIGFHNVPSITIITIKSVVATELLE